VSEREFACCIVPIFARPIDVVLTLRGYRSDKFSFELIAQEPDGVLGMIRDMSGAATSSIASTSDEQAAVESILSQLRSQVSVSSKDDQFVFSAMIDCPEAMTPIAHQLLQHHAIAFLRTLGPCDFRGC